MVGVSATNRELTGVEAGDEVEIELKLDTEPREIEVPDDLVAALDVRLASKRKSWQYWNSARLMNG